MDVLVVHVRHVRVGVPFPLVRVPMAVLAFWHGIVPMGVMTVVVPVRVFVLDAACWCSCPWLSARCRTTPASISRLPPAISQDKGRSPSATAPTAPMNGANANTDPVRAAPKARWASR